MAWTVGGSVYFCDFYLSAEGVDFEDLRSRAREHMEKIESKQFWEAFNAGKPTIYSGVGLAPPPEFLPRVARLTEGDKLYDFNSQGNVGGQVVSARFKTAHDKIQPGGNQFTPVKILKKDGSDYGGEYYIFHVTTVLDAIDPSLGGFDTYGKGEDVTYSYKSDSDSIHNKLAVHKNRLQGKAAWCDPRFGRTVYEFFSDEFLAELDAFGAKGFDKNYHFHEI
jgi:hypothetical protein